MEPDTKYFPKRNRIISGIANSVLVVEAEFRSGSSITAHFAKEQGKKVYAIPSNIDSSTGIGTNQLIREGATLITKPSQIKKEFFQKSHLSKTSNSKMPNLISNEQLSNIPKEYLPIYTLLEKGPMHINEIAKSQEKSISELNSIMTIMEIEGYITRLASNQYIRKE